jgi:hypothetical protein
MTGHSVPWFVALREPRPRCRTSTGVSRSHRRSESPAVCTFGLPDVYFRTTDLGVRVSAHPEPKPTRPEAIRRVLVAHPTGERLLPSRPDLRKGRCSIKLENLNAENDG